MSGYFFSGITESLSLQVIQVILCNGIESSVPNIAMPAAHP